jgi:hypothetical protein
LRQKIPPKGKKRKKNTTRLPSEIFQNTLIFIVIAYKPSVSCLFVIDCDEIVKKIGIKKYYKYKSDPVHSEDLGYEARHLLL